MAVTACLWKPVFYCCLCCHALLHCLYTMLSWVGWAVARDRCCAWTISVVREICPPPEPNTHTHTLLWPVLLFHHIDSCFLGCVLHLWLRPAQASEWHYWKLLLEKLLCFAQEFFPRMCSFVMFSADRKLTWPDLTHSLALLLGCVCVLHIKKLPSRPLSLEDRYINFWPDRLAMVQDRTRLAADSEDIQRHPMAWQRGRSL